MSQADPPPSITPRPVIRHSALPWRADPPCPGLRVPTPPSRFESRTRSSRPFPNFTEYIWCITSSARWNFLTTRMLKTSIRKHSIISVFFACSTLMLATKSHTSPPTLLTDCWSPLLFCPAWVETFFLFFFPSALHSTHTTPQSVISQQMFLISGQRRTCGDQTNTQSSCSTRRVHSVAGKADAGQTLDRRVIIGGSPARSQTQVLFGGWSRPPRKCEHVLAQLFRRTVCFYSTETFSPG